jgi:hypothetical protein
MASIRIAKNLYWLPQRLKQFGIAMAGLVDTNGVDSFSPGSNRIFDSTLGIQVSREFRRQRRRFASMRIGIDTFGVG